MASQPGTESGSPHVLDRLTDYFCGALPEADELAVEAHLLQCATCRAEYDDLGSAALFIAALPAGVVDGPDDWPVEDPEPP